jgi:hypothetical protein
VAELAAEVFDGVAVVDEVPAELLELEPQAVATRATAPSPAMR